MNTRKANLKKLRLPSTETKNDLRTGQRKATRKIPNFFSTDPNNPVEEEVGENQNTIRMECSNPLPSPIIYTSPTPSPIHKLEDEPKQIHNQSIRSKLKTFLPKEKRIKPAADNPISDFIGKTNDFETPVKTIKAAPKNKEKSKPKTKTKAKTKARPKKQQTIKSAFLKNEELFSDVTAQHCLVDNINPDDMQLALALSRSEAEVLEYPADVNVEVGDTESNDGIREKLKKFGFQLCEAEDFNYADAYKLTKGRNKWANKFTPLTLRNSKRQLEKVNEKIEEILNANYIRPLELATDNEVVLIYDSVLEPFVAKNRIIQLHSSEKVELIDFYVSSLFEPTKIKPGYLLKDVHRIPGRDRSPQYTKCPSKSNSIKDNSQSNKSPEKSLKNDCILHALDAHLESPVMKRIRSVVTPSPIECLSFPNADTSSNDAIEFSQESLPSTISVPRSAKERRRKKPSIQNTTIDSLLESACSNDNEMEFSFNLNEETLKPFNITTPTQNTMSTETASTYANEVDFQMQLQTIRANSPDIFADSDNEMETDGTSEIETLKCSSSENNIESFEIFSSDEAKTFLESEANPCDMNHNNFMVDLTTQKSETNSAISADFISACKLSEDLNELPSTSFNLKLNETCRMFRETNSSFENKKSEFSFGSSASDDFYKSLNKLEKEENPIDLTQSDDGIEDLDCIVLSDDEVNYSIRKAYTSLHFTDAKSSPDISTESDISKDKNEFSFVDFVAATQSLTASQSEDIDLNFIEEPNKSASSLDMDLSKRSDFGILEEQSPFKTPTKTPTRTPRKTPQSTPTKSVKISESDTSKCRRVLSESFLYSPKQPSPLKGFPSSSKFKEFTKSNEESFSDLDDIDKLIYGSPTKKLYKKPTGLTQLLTAPINEKITTPEKSDNEEPQEFNFNGRTYLVRTVDISQRPNFKTMDESKLFDKLYRYGIKPLKRKQAEKILEYIYNQTHPCLVDETDLPSTAIPDDSDLQSQDYGSDSNITDETEMNKAAVHVSASRFNFKDCWGHVLISDTIPIMEIKDEQYFFQTNISKKISMARLPLHIAWYNLLKSNVQLHEAILYYEPIDLQEVYLFFKSLGYRYDPKEIKYFFDSRSIIFQYDVKKSDKSAGNRHVRKKRHKVKL